ncbi:hypothetical protein Nmel_007959 [Mimus melanotis]
MHSKASTAVAERPETAFTPHNSPLHMSERIVPWPLWQLKHSLKVEQAALQCLMWTVWLLSADGISGLRLQGRSGASRLFGLQCQMAMQKGSAEGGTSSSTANNQVLQIATQIAFECPICLENIEEETSVSWCRHAFCFPCILEWSRIRAVCPICWEPFQYLFRKVGDNSYEVYSIGHYTSSARCNEGRRDRRHSAERRRHSSAGHRHRRSSRGGRGSSRARDWERGRSRSRRRSYDGHSRDQQAQSYGPSSSRRWQHSRVRDTDSETSRDWDRGAGHERNVRVRLGRSEHRQRAQWHSSRESWATSRRSHRSRWTSHSPERHRGR